jgi:hypothetical protein
MYPDIIMVALEADWQKNEIYASVVVYLAAGGFCEGGWGLVS